MSEAVTAEQDGGVIVITINRPDAKNAINGAPCGTGSPRRSPSWTPAMT
jgi:hypothetical protein